MGWTNTRLHQFVVGNRCYGQPDPDGGVQEVVNEKDVTLNELMAGEGARFSHEYDFGDRWEYEVVIEQILPFEANTSNLVCLARARHCPPEDCGGVWGYAAFLNAIQDPDHPEHAQMLE